MIQREVVSVGVQWRFITAANTGVEKGLQRLLRAIRTGGPGSRTLPLFFLVARDVKLAQILHLIFERSEARCFQQRKGLRISATFFRTLFWRSHSVWIVSTWLPNNGSLLGASRHSAHAGSSSKSTTKIYKISSSSM
jgi:hypothetical protein